MEWRYRLLSQMTGLSFRLLYCNQPVMKKKKNRVLAFIKILLLISGSIFILLCLLAFTKIPFYAYYSLGTSNSNITKHLQLLYF